jgi:hypothetical protein
MVKGRTKWREVEAKEYQLGAENAKEQFSIFSPKQ